MKDFFRLNGFALFVLVAIVGVPLALYNLEKLFVPIMAFIFTMIVFSFLGTMGVYVLGWRPPTDRDLWP